MNERDETPAAEPKTRGFSTIWVPTLAGAFVGAPIGAAFLVQAIGALWGDRAILAGLAYGATVGGGLGCLGGALLWAFFPYKHGE
jgi:hypothetical protein